MKCFKISGFYLCPGPHLSAVGSKTVFHFFFSCLRDLLCRHRRPHYRHHTSFSDEVAVVDQVDVQQMMSSETKMSKGTFLFLLFHLFSFRPLLVSDLHEIGRKLMMCSFSFLDSFGCLLFLLLLDVDDYRFDADKNGHHRLRLDRHDDAYEEVGSHPDHVPGTHDDCCGNQMDDADLISIEKVNFGRDSSFDHDLVDGVEKQTRYNFDDFGRQDFYIDLLFSLLLLLLLLFSDLVIDDDIDPAKENEI